MIEHINADDLSFSLTLHSPMTKEDWAKIEDLEMESVPAVTFTTPSGNEVEFVKVIRCEDCKNSVCIGEHYFCDIQYDEWGQPYVVKPNGFCDVGKRRESK